MIYHEHVEVHQEDTQKVYDYLARNNYRYAIRVYGLLLIYPMTQKWK